MEKTFNEIWADLVIAIKRLVDIFGTSLFKLGENDISLATILYIIFSFIVLTFFARYIKKDID